MLCTFLILPVSAAVEAEAKALSKIAPVLLKKMETASPDEKIPVAIWYTDIDQENVDKLTVDKVGRSQDDIALTYEMPSTELINKLEKGEEGALGEMQAYLKRTEKIRESERKRTNEYIMTRREFSREKYNEKSAKIIKEIAIEEKDIYFQSQYAPLLITNLTKYDINFIVRNIEVEEIEFYEEPEIIEFSLNSAMETTNVNLVNLNSELGLSGDGIKVGIIEAYAARVSNYEDGIYYIVPDNPKPNERYTSDGIKMTDYGNVVVVGDEIQEHPSENSHADLVANSLVTVAPNVILYTCDHEKDNIEGLITDGVMIISRSTGGSEYETSDDYAYNTSDKWYDHLVSNHSLIFVQCAGNTGDHYNDYYYEYKKDDGSIVTKLGYGARVCSPGMAYNAITVGAYTDALSGQSATDTLWYKSCYKNYLTDANGEITLSGCEKPDVVMPMTFNGEGTSNSTPFLAGTIALMLEIKPSLSAYPQVIKAIVLASCHRKVSISSNNEPVESIYSGITDRQGAGAPDVLSMVCIVCQGTYGVGRISAAKNQAVRRFVMPSYDSSSMNVSLTWIKENTIKSGTSHAVEDNAVEGADVNLDLSVYRNDGKNWHSKLSNSSTEMVYFDLNNSYKNYEIRISDVGAYEGVIRYGYAYSTNDPYITPATDEGIYYIRNYVSDKYLTLNTSTNETFMSDFTGDDNQQWVLRGTTGDYEVYPAHYSASQKINFGAQVGSNPYYKSVLGTNDLNLSMKFWETDTTLEPDAYVFTSTSGGSNNIMSYTYFTGVFVRSATESVINMYRMWVLEDINYQNGDANMDGVIDIKDATLISKGLANTITLSNAQRLLGDANYDGKVSIQDSTYIQKIVAKQE